MTIIKLDDFAENGDKNLTGIDVNQGFVQAEKPARQWFNFLFNSITKKVNEVITAVEELVISTDKIADGAVTVAKLAPDFEVTGGMIAKDSDLDTPKLTSTLAITTLDAPNMNLAEDGTLKRSNDPLNASTRKVGTAVGNLVERGADGYPTNNNAVGVGQTWQNVKASRALGVNYTNSTGKPIVIAVHARSSQSNEIAILVVTVGGVDVATGAEIVPNFASNPAGTCVIPTGAVYSVNVKNDLGVVRNLSVYSWSELR